MNRDSYLNFLEKFNISNEDFIEYGLNDIIFVPNDKVISEWEILKNKVYSNQEIYIRGMGRDATGTKYMQRWWSDDEIKYNGGKIVK